jgi:hypothetical protein
VVENPHLARPVLYLTKGSITFPSVSVAFVMWKRDSTEAAIWNIVDSAI